jgi:pseudouridine-5'-phosphate glycosidase
MRVLTGEASLRANEALLRHNAATAADIARALVAALRPRQLLDC